MSSVPLSDYPSLEYTVAHMQDLMQPLPWNTSLQRTRDVVKAIEEKIYRPIFNTEEGKKKFEDLLGYIVPFLDGIEAKLERENKIGLPYSEEETARSIRFGLASCIERIQTILPSYFQIVPSPFVRSSERSSVFLQEMKEKTLQVLVNKIEELTGSIDPSASLTELTDKVKTINNLIDQPIFNSPEGAQKISVLFPANSLFLQNMHTTIEARGGPINAFVLAVDFRICLQRINRIMLYHFPLIPPSSFTALKDKIEALELKQTRHSLESLKNKTQAMRELMEHPIFNTASNKKKEQLIESILHFLIKAQTLLGELEIQNIFKKNSKTTVKEIKTILIACTKHLNTFAPLLPIEMSGVFEDINPLLHQLVVSAGIGALPSVFFEELKTKIRELELKLEEDYSLENINSQTKAILELMQHSTWNRMSNIEKKEPITSIARFLATVHSIIEKNNSDNSMLEEIQTMLFDCAELLI